MSTTTNIVAYDYEAHAWVHGQAAVRLRDQQLREEIDLYSGPEGEDYARFLGIDRFKAMDLLRDSLNKLGQLAGAIQ